MNDRYQVIFRALAGEENGGPKEWADGIHWQAELHDAAAGSLGALPYPVAIAWLTEAPSVNATYMDFILVPDMCRREGYATALVDACEKRWSNLILTDAITDEGERFLESLEPEETT